MSRKGLPVPEEAMRELLWQAPLIDGHNDLLWELRQQCQYNFDRIDVAGHCPTLQTDLPRLRAGGVGAQFWSVWVPSHLPPLQAVVGTLEQLDALERLVDRYPDVLVRARTAADIEAARRSGRIASLAGVEGGHSIAGSLGVLRTLHRLGAAYLTLTHNDNTTWADAAMDRPEHGGLTDFGRAVVAEMNRIGLLVDLSHVAPQTMRDALAATTVPVIFSHSNARALCDHPRNIPDDVLAAMAGNGGLAMVTFVPGFISQQVGQLWLTGDELERQWRAETPDDPDEVTRRVAAWRALQTWPKVGVADVADHIDHIRELAGVAHIGIGSDFDGTPDLPEGLSDVSCYPALFQELAQRGYSRAELAGIAGGNLLRTMSDAQAGTTRPTPW